IIQGLLMVTLFLVGISTMVAIWNSAVSILMNDFIRRYFLKDKKEKTYVNVSRLLFILIGLVTVTLALTFVGKILLALTYVSVYTALLGFPVLAGFYWKRFNTSAALYSLISGVIYVTIALLFNFPYYLISPVGVLIGVVVGATTTNLTKSN